MESIGRKFHEASGWLWLIGASMVLIATIVYVFSWLGLYQATDTTATLHVPIFALSSSACTGVTVASASRSSRLLLPSLVLAPAPSCPLHWRPAPNSP